jgi:hypothetical protein
MGVGDLRSALRWPWDETRGGKYGAANDNGWVRWNGAWMHQSDLASTKAYWRRMGWAAKW